MIASIVILVLVTVQRLGELVLARRNTTRLLANGGLETGAGHYPLIVGLHAAWLIGLFVLAWDQPVNWIWMGVFVLLQLARIWVIASLGGRWTTRIITVPGETLVRRGPYRFLSHPNYVVVALEIGVLPLAFDLVAYAVVFSILNAAVLTIRIRGESRALAGTGTPEV
ncbi:isoprenylcysteine carboxyl methyltransferase family protein [Brevundimonas sp. SL161]|uniref:isoprenylcysteine carboxyl methyltransferase family protein n=1 Tax=Brevundimonas sp. SL161 TaxID=2804613 RepID=UPI003CF7C2D3